MILAKSPFRLSLFGGGTDYKSFYEKNGSLLIGTTINKYSYLSLRERPSILGKENVLSYSKFEKVKSAQDIENPLIREILKHEGIDCCIDFHHFTDVPHRTGLGGSSTFAVGLLYLIKKFKRLSTDKKELAKEAIYIERELLKEAGGIQDQIWAAYGGLNTIKIHKDGDFSVKPLPVTKEFKQSFEDSFVLIYTNEQRKSDEIAKSYQNKNPTTIKEIAEKSYSSFLREDIKEIGSFLYQSWLEKAAISEHISTSKINEIVIDVMNLGAFGVKIVGSGGCGFCAVMADPIVKQKIIDKYRDAVLEIKFENDGVKEIYRD